MDKLDKNNAIEEETIFFYDESEYSNDNDDSDEEYEASAEAEDESYSYNYTKHRHRQLKKRQTARIDRPVPPTSRKAIAKKTLREFEKLSARTESPRMLAALSLLPPSCRISNTFPRTEHFWERKIDDLYPDVYYDTSL